jgi:hypothetical protein
MLRERRWAIAAGLLGLSVGIVAFLLLLAVRGTYVSSRYLAPIDLALIMSAAIGLGRLRVPSLVRARFGRGLPALAIGTSALVGAIVGVALSVPFGPLDRPTRSVIRDERLSAQHADHALATISRELDTIPASRQRAGSIDPHANLDSTQGGDVSLLVPVLLRPRMSIDLNIPLNKIGGLTARDPIPDAALLHPGEVIFHDRLGDAPVDGYAAFEREQPSAFGTLQLQPLMSDVAGGWWVLAAR